jgi:hypothetical protein
MALIPHPTPSSMCCSCATTTRPSCFQWQFLVFSFWHCTPGWQLAGRVDQGAPRGLGRTSYHWLRYNQAVHHHGWTHLCGDARPDARSRPAPLFHAQTHSFSNSLVLKLTHPGEHDLQLAHCSWFTVKLARSPPPQGTNCSCNQVACLSLVTCCHCCLSQAPRALAAPGGPHLPGHGTAVPPGPMAPALGQRARTGHQQGPSCLLERSGGADDLRHEAHYAAHEDQTLHCISGV